MNIYRSEDEQVEALKKWLKENGKSVIAGLVIGLGVVLGWRGWQDHQERQAQRASADFEQMMSAVQRKENESALKEGELIKKEYGSTPYAALSSLALARISLEQGDPAGAKAQLGWAMQHADSEEIRHIARLRLARVLFGTDEHDAALDLVAAVEPGGFAAAYEELKGDLYKVRGQVDDARLAYTKALAAGTRNRDLVQMKLNDLGSAPGEES